jgi:cytochrome b561
MNKIITGYGPTAKLLHWVIVALLVVQYAVAWSMEGVDEGSSAAATPMHGLHVSLGVTIFALALLRLIWRQTHPVPEYPDLPKWQHYSARVTHALLYALIVTMPVLGVLALSGEATEAQLFGVLRLSLPVVPDALVELSEEAHEVLGIGLLTVIALHVAAALYHFVIIRDRVLQRMLPGSASRS